MSIDAGDLLSFVGSLVGAAAGIVAAFLAVERQRNINDKASLETILQLIDELERTAMELRSSAETGPSPAARAVYRSFCALRDVAIGVRTSSASIATLAARMEHTTVYPELVRIVGAPENGVAALDAKGRSAEIVSLCKDVRNYFV
ncbi:MAG: hypothetical protein V4579_11245 [Pseudomonadota bacterium]